MLRNCLFHRVRKISEEVCFFLNEGVICSRCERKNSSINVFCNSCGHKLSAIKKSVNKSEYVISILEKQNKMTWMTIVGGLGIIIVGITLFQILENEQIQVDPYLISSLGLLLFISLILVSVTLKIKTDVDELTPLLLIILAEILMLISQFILDSLERTTYSRNLLLWSSIIISATGAFSVIMFNDNQLQQIHRIGTAYAGWIVIYYLAGSNYVSELSFTTAVIIQILLMHLIGLIYPTIIVVSAYVSLEFLILIQSRVINSTSIFFVGIVVIISIPVILYLKKYSNLVIRDHFISNNMLILLYSIPLLSIIISVSNGALIAPYTHILFGLFCISWSIYIYIFRNEETYRDTLQSLSKSMILLFIIGITNYSFNNSGVDLIALHIGLTVAILFLRNILNYDYQIIAKLINLIVTILVSYQLYIDNYFHFVTSLTTFVLSFLIIFGKEIFLKKITEIDFILFNLSISSFSSMIFLQRQFSILLIIGNLFALCLVYLVFYKSKYLYRYWTIIAGQVLVLLSFTRYAELDNNEIITIISCSAFLFLIGFIDRSLLKDYIVIGWSALSLPLILILNDQNNHYLINAISFMLLGFGFFSIFKRINGVLNNYLPLIFGLAAVFSRIITRGDTSEILGLSVWSISIIFIYIYIGCLIFLMVDITTVNNKFYLFFIYNLSWLITGFFILEKSEEYNDLKIRKAITTIILILFLVQLVLINFQAKLFNSFKRVEKINSISILGILSYLLLISSPLIRGYQLLWYPIIFFLILPSFTQKDLHLLLQEKLIWFVSIGLNLILMLSTDGFSFVLSILIIQFIYLNSSYFRQVFGSLTAKTTKNSLIFDMCGYFIITTITVFLLNNLIGIIIWSLLIFQFLWKNIKEKVEIEGLHLIQAMVISYTSLFWLINQEYEYLTYSIGLVVSILFIYLDKNKLLENTKSGIIPTINESTLAVSSLVFAQIIGICWIIAENKFISLDQLIRFVAIVMLIILVIGFFIERTYSKTILSDGLIIASFIIAITSTLIGYFETSLSNLILATLAISISIISLLLKEPKLFNIGIGVSVLSLLKGIFDLILLDGLDRSMSLLVVGIQAIWYAIVYNSLQEKLSDQ